MFKLLTHIIQNNKLQPRNRNRVLARKMKAIGFTRTQIRLALMAANQVKINKIQTDELKSPLLSRTIHGTCKRNDAKKHISDILNLNIEDIF